MKQRALSTTLFVLAIAMMAAACCQGQVQTKQQDQRQPVPYKRIVGPETINPGAYPGHFPYPDEYDALAAAPEVHHLRYADGHVLLVEVAYFPGVHGQMHGHPNFSVFAVDSPTPKSKNIQLDPQNKLLIGRGPAPQGMEYPLCKTMNPQSPHAETNLDTWPHHFYRISFLRVDGTGFQQHWQEWYPNMTRPEFVLKSVPRRFGPAFSSAWPYPIGYDSLLAAPSNERLLFEDDHIRFVEVTIRPGETEPMSGDPYPSVVAMDTPLGHSFEDKLLDPNSPLNGQGAGFGGPPPGFDAPTCTSSAPRAPHSIHNNGTVPIHYYRVDFKRIDGDGIKTHWREWYPWMGVLADEYHAHPYVSNYQ
jgi:hypothetical protein